MLAQEWDWNKALEINTRDAERATELRVNEAWRSVVAEKDAAIEEKDTAIAEKDTEIAEKDTEIAEKDAEITALKAMLEDSQKNP